MISRADANQRDRSAPPEVHLRSLGSALPPHRWSQDEAAHILAGLWRLNPSERARWQRIIDGSGIAFRHAVRPVEAIVPLTTAARMSLFEQHAAELAARAAERAIDAADIDRASITDLIIVTCTGFRAPGIDVDLIERLHLPRTVRRMQIGFMGCFGAITGLRAAHGLAGANEAARVLVVCVELCSLHIRAETDAESLVASALFADGAAAAIVDRSDASDTTPTLGQLEPGGSVLIPGTRDRMSWRITDHGFAMTLDPRVARELAPAVETVAQHRPGPWIVHPGGPRILDAIESVLPADSSSAMPFARDVLRDCGNMSSPSVLFVLERALATSRARPCHLAAFGPGLTLDYLSLSPQPFLGAPVAGAHQTAQVPAE